MRVRTLALIGALLLAGCGQKAAESGGSPGAVTAEGRFGGALGRLASFSFALSYRLPGEAIEKVQRAQEDACEALGPDKCIVLASQLRGRNGIYGEGALTVIAAREFARPLARNFTEITRSAGGNLTRQDMRGTLAGHVEVDGPAEAQTEGGLVETVPVPPPNRAAAAYSRIAVTYRSVLPVGTGSGRPLAEAWAGASERWSGSVAAILEAAFIIGPFAGTALMAWGLWRRLHQRSATAGV
jgi:hypothetical protein